VKDDFGLEVKLIDSNMHTFLLNVNKKKGDAVNNLISGFPIK
jgi:hypothetical protein